MFLKKLHIQNFRNHSSFIAEFRPGINIITGKNGAGKTNILEAIFFLSTSASPRASSYADMMKKGRNYFFIRAGIIEGEKKYTLTAGYASEKGFVAKLNGNRLNRRKLLEIFPVVLFSPEDIDIFKGPPGGMRRLFNINIAQTNNAYIENLLKFRRLLKERNRILKARRPGKAKDLRAWTSTLVKYAKRIHAMRRDYVGKANKEIQEELKKAGIKSKIKINYKISSYDSQVSPVKDNDKGYTTWGPQRDRFEFKFDGAQVSRYASRGETRTAAFIYRMATLKMIARASEKSPLVLLDDVFSELDAGKRDAISKRLQGRQAILTHTEIPGELENRLSGVIKI